MTTLRDLAREWGCQVYEAAAELDLGREYDETAEITPEDEAIYRAAHAAGQDAAPHE
mgnify:CR=1 FL=1